MASLDHEAPGAMRRCPARGRSRLASVLLLGALTSVAILVRGDDDERLPPDLRVDWILGSRRIRNIGGRDAFAVNVEGRTALGRLGRPRRYQPGPAAGGAQRHAQSLTLASGMRELCFEARLQVLSGREPAEQNLDDNQACRPIELRDETDEDGSATRSSLRRSSNPGSG